MQKVRCAGMGSLFDDVFDVFDDKPLEGAVVDLAMALGGQVND